MYSGNPPTPWGPPCVGSTFPYCISACLFVMVRLPHVELMFHRLHDEGELIVSIVEPVFFARKMPPTVYTSESHLCLVYTDVRGS